MNPGNASYDDREAPARRAYAKTQGRIGDWMQTASGRMFWLLDPRANEVFIDDIAWHLALICRYNGSCGLTEPWHYSVGQHSVYVSQWLEAQGYDRATCFAGLMHDAPEAYCCDIHRPLKRGLAGYKGIEQRIWLAVAERFNLPPDLPACIKEADDAVLLAEQSQVMKPTPAPWHVPGTKADILIAEWAPRRAWREFLDRFAELSQ